MTETTQKEIKRLANKYSVHGITAETIAHIVETAPEDMSEHAALVGARMCLALETGETEYYTAADVASVTGETEKEIKARMKKAGITEYKVTNILDIL